MGPCTKTDGAPVARAAGAARNGPGRGASEADFDREEAEVLQWLLGQPEVAESVDLALAGREQDALPLLLRTVKGILGEETIGAAGAPVAEAETSASVGAGADAAPRTNSTKRNLEEDPEVQSQATQRLRPNQGEGDEWLPQFQRALAAERAKESIKLLERLDSQCSQLDEEEQASSPKPLYWKIELPEVSKVLSQKGILPAHFVRVANPHTTLLYLGDGAEKAPALQRLGLSVEQFNDMHKALEALQGKEVEVRVMQIVLEECIACAVVSLPAMVPCANKVPHVTLGMKEGTPPAFANEFLEEVKAGRREGVTTIDLPTPRPLKGTVSLQYSEPGGS